MMGQGASSQPQLCRPPDLIKVSHADGCGRPVASSGCRPHLCTPELQPKQPPPTSLCFRFSWAFYS